ncbi:MAG TPA: rhodanese-like domain-containing protein [Hansschlegelia sp.]
MTAAPASQRSKRARKRPVVVIEAREAIALYRRKQAVLVDLSDWESADETGWIQGSFHCPPGEFAGLIDPASPLHARLFEPGKVFIFYGGPKFAPLAAARRARALGLDGALALRGGLKAWRNAGGRVAGHPQSPFPVLKASFGFAMRYALSVARAKYARLKRSFEHA